MNIFILDDDPKNAARMHCDKHVPKMIVESAQMLSTAHRILDGKEYIAPSKSGKRMLKHYRLPDHDDVIYKAVHAGHPCTKWTMQSSGNYNWHYNLFRELSTEFSYRFGKVHRSWEILKDILYAVPANIPKIGSTPYAKAMKAYPDIESIEDPVEAYQQFYKADKINFAKWEKGRSAPIWWNNK
mgnify:FL=1|tara:strand:+ start:3342 stop:3893 length:552 start_codon:yes stop_codon:yes gene_type:complete